jgi:hypothetical protein
MDAVQDNLSYNFKRTWYNNEIFPLIPIYRPKKSDEHNTAGFSFSWLFIKIWSLDAFGFELAVNVDGHWGIGVTAILPYLRVVLCIPCPQRLGMWVQRNLWRRPKNSRY